MAKRSLLHVLRTYFSDPAACSFAWKAIRRHYAVQSLWELTHLVGDVIALKPSVIMEIGTHRGGTLFVWSRIVPESGTLVSLDLPAHADDAHTTVPALEKLIPAGQKCTFLREDSHLPATLEKAKAALGGKQVDFLFIDGDHSYEGVKLDFEMYSPLVRKGGLIAFHDIAPNPEVSEYGVAKYWQELRATHRVREYVDPNPVGPVGMGIGVVEV